MSYCAIIKYWCCENQRLLEKKKKKNLSISEKPRRSTVREFVFVLTWTLTFSPSLLTVPLTAPGLVPGACGKSRVVVKMRWRRSEVDIIAQLTVALHRAVVQHCCRENLNLNLNYSHRVNWYIFVYNLSIETYRGSCCQLLLIWWLSLSPHWFTSHWKTPQLIVSSLTCPSLCPPLM